LLGVSSREAFLDDHRGRRDSSSRIARNFVAPENFTAFVTLRKLARPNRAFDWAFKQDEAEASRIAHRGRVHPLLMLDRLMLLEV